MHLGIRSEQAPSERRVAATPQSVSSLVALGVKVTVESGAGLGAGFTDDQYIEAGAHVVDRFTPDAPLDIFATVGPFVETDTRLLADGAVVIGMLEPVDHQGSLSLLALFGEK